MAKCSKCGDPINYNRFKIDKNNQIFCLLCWKKRPKRKYIKRQKLKENFNNWEQKTE